MYTPTYILSLVQYIDRITLPQPFSVIQTMASTHQAQCIFALLLIFVVLASQVMSRNLHDASLTQTHEEWIAKYGKVYKDAAEKERRFNIFNDNVKFIRVTQCCWESTIQAKH